MAALADARHQSTNRSGYNEALGLGTASCQPEMLMGAETRPFPKIPREIITVTIDENSDLIFLSTDKSDVFLEMGKTVKRRASHVEPEHLAKRIAFRALRGVFGDHGRVADWTRGWSGKWRVDTRPTAGVVLHQLFDSREEAITAEIEFLNKFFLEGS